MTNVTDLHQQLARVILADRPLTDVLEEITKIGHDAIDASEASSITLIRGERPTTAAYEGQLARDAEQLQYDRGHGPCLDAGRAGLVFVVTDMRSDQRWPDYARHASERGVASSMSLPLPFQGATIGAFNAYATRPEAFTDDDVSLGVEVAAWLAIAAGNGEAADRSATDAENMRRAMASRATIDQAKGILMERYKIDADAAFTVLSHASQQLNIKLRDVADHLVLTGEVLGAR
jgi:GAF domain-containing protein